MADVQVIRHRQLDDEDELDADYPDEYHVLGEAPVQLDKSFASAIIVDNLPVVGREKFDKLLGVVTKIYSQIPGGAIIEVFMPTDEKGQTKGYAFVEFSTVEAARNAVQQTNGYKLDRAHIFRVNFFEDFQVYDKVTDAFQPIEMPTYKPKENVWWWLIEEPGQARDQYALRYSDMTEIFWNEGKKKAETHFRKKDMTETYVTWSPHGTYLGTFHRQGVILWGTEKWDKVMRFQHPGVKLLDFSPRENYLVTFSTQLAQNDNPKDPQGVIIWDVHTGLKKRGFVGSKEMTWPTFKWSHDEKYFARLSADTVSIYETPSMQLLDKKSFKLPGVKDFQWSPSNNVIACYIPGQESGDKPARVLLIDIPSRNILRSHNLFKVVDCSLHWQSAGDYLCVKVERKATKKTTTTAFEIYRMREKDVPLETVDVKGKIEAFAWEPKGHRFAVIHSTEERGSRNDISFYTTKGPGGKAALLKSLEKRQANHVFWSPKGHLAVLAGFGAGGNGLLEFYNVDDLESMRTDQHSMASELQWDPSGRFVATSSTYWAHPQSDNGYVIWSFHGKRLANATKDKFFQFLWRPRPPTLLRKEKQTEIEKNLRQYAVKYRRQDLARKRAAWEAFVAKRRQERDAWHNSRHQRAAERDAEKAARAKLRGGVGSDDEDIWDEVEEEVEDLVEEEVEVIDY
jgi:translation initiation factor 3 subunit B